jgi:hypothetical protein
MLYSRDKAAPLADFGRLRFQNSSSRIVLCRAVLTLIPSALWAQKRKPVAGVITGSDKKTTSVTNPSGVHTPYVDDNAGSTVIFSNLATASPNGLYWCYQGVSDPLVRNATRLGHP